MLNPNRYRKFHLPAILAGLTFSVALLGVVTLSHAREGKARVEGGVQACQVDAEGAGRRIVNKFLTRPGFADGRVKTGTVGLDTTDVRLLVDPADTQECITLNTAFGLSSPQSQPEHWMYFRSDQGHIFVIEILPPTPPGVIRLRWTPMWILDSDYKFLGGYMM